MDVVLYKVEGPPWWMVDAAIDEKELRICSGDSHREWYAMVAADAWPVLLDALRAEGARSADADADASLPRQIMDALVALYGNRPHAKHGPFEEIKRMLERRAVPHRTQVW